MPRLSHNLDPSTFGPVQRASYEAATRQERAQGTKAGPVGATPPKPEKSRLAVQFENIWANINGQTLVEEWQGIPGRQFRFDYTALDADTGRVLAIIELEGITHQGGRHQRKEGFERDVDKYFMAQMLGYTVIRLTRKILKQPENLVLVRQYIERQRTP